MVRTIGPVTATSASWKVITRAPILISLSFRLVSDYRWWTLSPTPSRRQGSQTGRIRGDVWANSLAS